MEILIRPDHAPFTAAVLPEAATPMHEEAAPVKNELSPASVTRLTAAQREATIDDELIRRFKGGDEAAFAEIVGRYREKILAIAVGVLRNHADAEEIAQDTFIRAHRGLAQFRGDASLATWLHRITLNLARNRYWYFFRRCRHLSLSLDSALSAESNETFCELVATNNADPAQQATIDEFVVLVSVCMKKLEPTHFEILTLRNLLHRSYSEIASTLCINEGTVKSRIARARGKLRDLIAETYPEFPTEMPDSGWFEPARGVGILN
jgi:RNA polymerase sigma-70 factor, ECF subfamily